MDSAGKLYIIGPANPDSLEGIYAIFDTMEKAQDFLVRFKTPTHLEIVEFPLNPKYIVNKLADPYFVILRKTEKETRDLYIADYIDEAEEAEKEAYSFDFHGCSNKEQGRFNIMLFAASEQEALARAIIKRDQVIASGEWDKTFEEKIKSKESY